MQAIDQSSFFGQIEMNNPTVLGRTNPLNIAFSLKDMATAALQGYEGVVEQNPAVVDEVLAFIRLRFENDQVAGGLPQELVEAVDDPELYGGVWPPDCIPDLIFVANLIAETPNPFSPEPEDLRHGLAKAATLGLDEVRLVEVLAESEEERKALTDLFNVV